MIPSMTNINIVPGDKSFLVGQSETFMKLLKMAEEKLNVLLIGDHGIGKTEIFHQIMAYLGLTAIYLSASTLDPYCDIIGIPVPMTTGGNRLDGATDEQVKGAILKYVRDHRLQNAHVIMLDELNRSAAKVRNACFEMIQFKAIQGEKMPNLQMVWSAVNNPDSEMHYSTEELDPALVDRYHAYVEMKAEPNKDVYVRKGYEEGMVKKFIAWWHTVGEKGKRYLTPRRLEYMMMAWSRGIDLSYVLTPKKLLPNCPEFTIQALIETLESKEKVEEMVEVFKNYDADYMIRNFEEIIAESYQVGNNHHLVESFKKMKAKDLVRVAHLLPKLQTEFQFTILDHFSSSLEKNIEKLKEKAPVLANWVVETRKAQNAAGK